MLYGSFQVLFAQWFQPHETIHLSRVISDVELIALDTLKMLKKVYPDHPIFKKNSQQKGGYSFPRLSYCGVKDFFALTSSKCLLREFSFHKGLLHH